MNRHSSLARNTTAAAISLASARARPVRQVMAAVPAGYRAPAAEAMIEVLLAVGAEWERAGQAVVYA